LHGKSRVQMTSIRELIWHRVAIEAIRHEADTSFSSSGLVRGLGPIHLTMIGIGATIGAGVFVLTGTAAAHHAGPAIALSYVIAGAVSLLIALCYAELSAVIPSAGGSFSYARVILGRLPAWLIGWCMVSEYLIGGSTVAVGWSGYAQDLLAQFGLPLPHEWSGAPVDVVDGKLVVSGRFLDVPAVLMIAGCSWILLRGLRGSAIVNTSMVVIKLVVIVAVIAVGAFYVRAANWVPFVPPVTPDHQFGWGGVFTATAIAFYAYTGFEAVSTAARECRQPTRDLPIALLATLVICAALFIGIGLVLTGLAPYPKLDSPAPLATALAIVSSKLRPLISIVDIGTVLGLGSAVMMSLYSQSRTFYSMAVVGHLPKRFARVHPSYRTPTVATLWTGAGAAILAGVLPIELLGELVSMGTLIAFSSVCLGVLILRRSRPDIQRPFLVPLHPWIPLVGLTSCFGLMCSLPRIAWLNLALWMTLGLALFLVSVFFARGHRIAASPSCPEPIEQSVE
jgi:basic amino acid/polyamine antiporter, APA family